MALGLSGTEPYLIGFHSYSVMYSTTRPKKLNLLLLLRSDEAVRNRLKADECREEEVAALAILETHWNK